MSYVWKLFNDQSSSSGDSDLRNVRYLNISDDEQFAILARKLLSGDVAAAKVDYATFNSNLQSLQVRPVPRRQIFCLALDSQHACAGLGLHQEPLLPVQPMVSHRPIFESATRLYRFGSKCYVAGGCSTVS